MAKESDGYKESYQTVQIVVYQELEDMDNKVHNNLIYCGYHEPGETSLSILESNKAQDEIVNGILRRVFDAILMVKEVKYIELIECGSKSVLENNISKSNKFVSITLRCEKPCWRRMEDPLRAAFASEPVSIINFDEAWHLIKGLKSFSWYSMAYTFGKDREDISLAIDIGSTYSRYGFSFKSYPRRVHVNNWYPKISWQTCTTVLLNHKGEFHSFGDDAERTYQKLAKSSKHHSWRLFRRFKMFLYNVELSHSSTVNDIEGNPHLALPLFTMVIRHLHGHALKRLNESTEHRPYIRNVVITVPALWGISGKKFMTKIAVNAGIDGARLTIAFEPEAAMSWCASTVDMLTGYMVMLVDLGGETVNISVQKKDPGGGLTIHAFAVCQWGGKCVDENYINFLAEVFGKQAIAELMSREMNAYFDIIDTFHWTKTKLFSKCNNNRPRLFINGEIFETARKLCNEKYMRYDDFINSTKYGSSIELKNSRLRVHSSIVESWFEDAVSKLINHLLAMLKDPRWHGVNDIVLVGGFANSSYVQHRMMTELPGMKLTVPNDADLAVVKGAVVLGHQRYIKASRVIV